ncbi:MAG: YbeD family protein [Gammaproteobacteria bacterium]
MSDTSPLKFPLEFPVKIMGRDTQVFHDAVAVIFAEHVAPIENLKVARQSSSAGRFISVTVTFTAESREQLDALYRALTASEHVLMTL